MCDSTVLDIQVKKKNCDQLELFQYKAFHIWEFRFLQNKYDLDLINLFIRYFDMQLLVDNFMQ